MWCRALLAATALTYVICVLLLSGLQKDDLEATLLEKLRRRGVNVDDINNESIREKCTTETFRERLQSTSENIGSTISYSYEHTQQVLLQKPPTGDTKRQVPKEENKSNNQIPNTVMKNFMNLYWKMIGTEPEIETITIDPTTLKSPVSLTYNNGNYSTNNLEYINTLLLNYIAAKQTTAVIPSSTAEVTPSPKLHIDIISQKIKELLEQTRDVATTTQLHTTQASVKIESDIDKSAHSVALKYIEEYMKQLNKVNKLNFDNKQNDKPTKKPDTASDMTERRTNIRIDPKNISDDVINEITEKVKASVLRDLEMHISALITENTTAVPENTSTSRSTTLTTLNNTSNMLEQLVKLFNQLNLGKDAASDKIYALDNKKNTMNEFHGAINVLYPPLIPVNYIVPKNETMRPTPMMAYPYNQFSLINHHEIQKIESPQPNQGPNLESLSAFNLDQAHNRQIPTPVKPINVQTMQSEVGLIPPLLIEMPKQVSIRHHMIVTTKRPYEYESYIEKNKPRDFSEPNTDFYDMTRINRNTYVHREGKSDGEIRNRNARDELYKERLNNLRHDQVGRYYHARHNHRNYDRFHDLLEKPEDYPDFEQEKGPKLKPRLKVSSRQQLALQDLKNRPRIDEAHFRNFLKTQQKVNDMLERLLATKSDTRSVEVS